MKSCKVLFLLMAVAMMLMSGSAYATIVGQWNFNAGSGTTVADSSAYGNTGTLGTGTNTPGWVASGRSGLAGDSCLDFTRTASTYVSVGTPESLSITNNNITVDAWIKPQFLVTQISSIVDKQSYDLCLRAGKQPEFVVQLTKPDGIANASVIAYSSTVLTNNSAWIQLTGTYDGHYVKIYENGVEKASTDITASGFAIGAAIWNFPTRNLTFGNGGTGLTTGVDALIDDVTISTVPEPATLTLLGGLSLMTLLRRKRK